MTNKLKLYCFRVLAAAIVLGLLVPALILMLINITAMAVVIATSILDLPFKLVLKVLKETHDKLLSNVEDNKKKNNKKNNKNLEKDLH